MSIAWSTWKKLRLILLTLLILGLAIQFIRPQLDHPPVSADLKAPEEVKAIIRRACYDCHSNETKLAWFDEPAPAYWLVVKDVKEGRKVLNFSSFDSLPKAQQAGKWFESIMQIEQHAMPLSQYTRFHHGGLISAEELATLKKYVGSLAYVARQDTAREHALLDQVEKSMKTAVIPTQVKDEYNGIGYAELAGFSDWRFVSTTERYDNGTLRLILGNDITVRAIREGHTNPWPDGAVFAKIAFDQLPDSSSGLIRAGAFRQVEFMIRDSRKYASTFGWGWARWVGGLGLKPYGKDENFVSECMNCHRPFKSNDYTFTIPLADTLELAGGEIPPRDNLSRLPMTGKVITCFVDKEMGKGMQSVLYGNDIAVDCARHGQPYKAGATISLLTWSQREDPHWFGGRIPETVSTVEVVSFDPQPSYHMHSGPGLGEVEPEAGLVAERTGLILGLKAAVLP